MSKAHNLEEKERTKDVLIEEQLNFNALLLSEETLSGLQKQGFKIPSPIQLKAIPIGKCGFDLIVKSKSGTGKTLVFGLIALEAINLNKNSPQVLILAPTREIAVQIQHVIQDLGSEYKGLHVESFIGGRPIEEDIKKAQKCHIAVGAPGRVRHLIEIGALKVKYVKLFVLDEVDKLMTQNGKGDIDEISSKLPVWKQTIAVSATLPKETEEYLQNSMSSPTLVEPTTDSPLLLGIKQFVDTVKTNLNIVHQLDIKSKELIRLLSQISFTQCLVFTNYQTRAASVCNHLNRHGWNSMYISADQKQTERLKVMEALKSGECRILLSTDLTARGIDASNVDLTINYDVPHEASTYLHRMGRAGRFGSKGICISIVTEEELKGLKKLLGTIAGGNFLIARLPKTGDLPSDLINFDTKDLEFEQSEIDLIKDQEKNNLLSSIVDLKTSLIPKKNKSKFTKKEKNKPKDESESVSDVQNETIKLQRKDKGELDLNIQGFSQSNSDSTLNPTELSKNLENSELESLLSMLESNESPSNIFDNNSLELETKKRKRNDKTKTHNEICNKNITLLHVAEILSGSQDTKVEEGANSLNQLKESLQFDDSFEITNESQSTTSQIITSNNTEESNIENIFKLSYDYAIKPGAPNWVETLGVDLTEKMVLEEPEPKEVITFIRSPKKRYKSSKTRKNEKQKSKSNTKQTKHDFDKDSCTNTRTDSYSNLDSYHEEIVNNKVTTSDVAIKSSNSHNSNNRIEIVDKPSLSGSRDHEYYDNQHFIDCFQKYSDELTEKMQTFEDMASFETWYQQWQWQVQSVREYVQQNIYVQEMNRYMCGNMQL